jgi:tRNA A-37 threonylcarbamoyl transferase component Bud32
MSRHRWVRELLDFISRLEELGFTWGDMAVCNLAINSSNHLKFFDFGSAMTNDHYDDAADVKRDHSGLASRLHYILTRVDSFGNVNLVQEVRQTKSQLLAGCGTVRVGAEILTDVIYAS